MLEFKKKQLASCAEFEGPWYLQHYFAGLVVLVHEEASMDWRRFDDGNDRMYETENKT